MVDLPVEMLTSLGLGGLLLLWATKYLIPNLLKRFDDSLVAFRQELQAERDHHERLVNLVRDDIRGLEASILNKKRGVRRAS